jgi:hypothetical protein
MAQKLSQFDPPGYPYVDDKLSSEARRVWSDKISSWMNTEIKAELPNGTPLNSGGYLRTPLPQFFNGTTTAYEVDQAPQVITWTGFPKLVSCPFR